MVLDDGARFPGVSFGAAGEVAGEVVFNTGMTGYVEALTDPSYAGQILVFTYPLQGNYGVPEGPWESDRVHAAGVVVGRLARHPAHHRMVQSLGDWLERVGVPGIEGVDTRALTMHLRSRGTTPGALLRSKRATADAVPDALEMRTVAERVAKPGIETIGAGDRRVLLIDCGAKRGIVEALLRRGIAVERAAFFERWETRLPHVDGVVVPNGPGDPADLTSLVERLGPLLASNLPVLGICLGHQLLAMAAGASTYKLPFGHRSQNQPVLDLLSGRAYLTAQNHGYAVRSESIPRGFVPWFRNLNDGTNEGIRHENGRIFSVQFHPEGAAGPHDTQFVFDRYADLVHAMPQRRAA